jgi:hypothetical protein
MKRILLALLLTASLVSCKKDKDPVLEGKWTLKDITWKEFTNGTQTDSGTDAGVNETHEFRADGTLIFTEGTNVQTTTYTLNGDQVTFEGETYTVQNLEDNSVTLYYKDIWGTNSWDDVFINLTR